MRELALFAGAGGGILGSKLLGWETVCAVEINPYCREVLEARQRDGWLESFPIENDVRSFDGTRWRGLVDVVSGGFPCQPFSSASHGRKVAIDLWPDMRRIIGEVSPEWVFAENVAEDPINHAADDLEAMGYRVRCCKLGSADVGAPSLRSRYWLVGRSHTHGKSECEIDAKAPRLSRVPNPFPWPDPPGDVGVVDGVASRVDRLRALGNGQVPRLAAIAFTELAGHLA